MYQVSGDECGVARGRNMYAKELVEGRLDISRRNDAFFSECLLCRACVDACFSSVKTDEIVLAGRRCLRSDRGVSPAHRHIFERLLPDHNKLGKFIRALGAARRVAPELIMDAMRIFGWLGSGLGRAERIAENIPREFLRERLTRTSLTSGAKVRVMYFIGCGVNFMFPEAGEATVEVLRAMGFDVTTIDHGCCGLPAFSHGDITSARRLAMHNLDVFHGEGAGCLVVTDCSSCASYLKDYPKLFAGETSSKGVEHSRALEFSGRVRDLTEMLAGPEFARLLERKSVAHKTPAREDSTRSVTFHEPCHLGRYQGLGDAARDVLNSLPGTDLVEMKEAAWCCGGAGAFAVEHPDLSLAILERKTRNIESSAAADVVTTCPACLMQIRSGIENAGMGTGVRHLSEIARDCLRED